jgi:hypothetical protein
VALHYRATRRLDVVVPEAPRQYAECMISELDAAVLEAITQSTEPLAAAFRWVNALGEATVGQHQVSVGRRSAPARVAHLLLELGDRLQLAGRADAAGFRCPLTQLDIADALGLTSVHVSRTLKQLREMGCLTFRNGFVAFDDREPLVELAFYDASFLDPVSEEAAEPLPPVSARPRPSRRSRPAPAPRSWPKDRRPFRPRRSASRGSRPDWCRGARRRGRERRCSPRSGWRARWWSIRVPWLN